MAGDRRKFLRSPMGVILIAATAVNVAALLACSVTIIAGDLFIQLFFYQRPWQTLMLISLSILFVLNLLFFIARLCSGGTGTRLTRFRAFLICWMCVFLSLVVAVIGTSYFISVSESERNEAFRRLIAVSVFSYILVALYVILAVLHLASSTGIRDAGDNSESPRGKFPSSNGHRSVQRDGIAPSSHPIHKETATSAPSNLEHQEANREEERREPIRKGDEVGIAQPGSGTNPFDEE